MRRPGGIRITEERELHRLRGALSQYPATVTAILETASQMRRPVDTISAEDVEPLSNSITLVRLTTFADWSIDFSV
jgi:hypothetical protein